jgi:hypothetical protein
MDKAVINLQKESELLVEANKARVLINELER